MFLLAALAYFRARLKSKDSQISTLKGQVVHEQKQSEIHQTAQETVQAVIQQQQQIIQEQQEEEELIHEAVTDEDLISIGNELIDSWNSRIVPDSPED
ncbi:hypothetical protein [Parasphaerochaeta coccoides]|uniref:hypothetical protein n=1 Tax=Parasphaerochaeta coccoides TaxID=273376 RepID=UPI0002F2FD7E|nr:hypothetical protein [Parasphaerochaeta coccoides]